LDSSEQLNAMMRRRIATAVLLVVLAGTVFRLIHVWQTQSLVPVEARTESTPSMAAEPPQSNTPLLKVEDAQPAAETADPATLSQAVPVQPRKIALAGLSDEDLPKGPEFLPGITPTTLLENMRVVFRLYSQRFAGNPVGNNQEITAALNGANPRQVVFLNPEDGMRVNERGQLIDNWGTPFFFHQLSRMEMEIRSAGPDRKMWTPDDLTIK
jgi:hypothetical protein